MVGLELIQEGVPVAEISKEGDPSVVREQTVFAIHTNGLEISKA